MLAAFAPFATDMYLPGLPLMAADFDVDAGAMGSTLSVFFLGLCMGQALYGPLIDRHGRRVPLLVGVTLYVLTTACCLLTRDLRVLIGLRFVQAIGGSAGMIVGRAIVKDLFGPREGARALSLLLAIMTLAPLVAPVLGGFIITRWGWQSVFLAMLAFGLLCWALVWSLLPETLEPEQRRHERITGVARAWGQLLTQRNFVVPALVGGLAQASMFAFITGSPAVFIELHGVDAQTYGWLFATVASSLVICAQLNRVALRRWSPTQLLKWGLRVHLLAGLGSVAAVPTGNLGALVLALWFAIGALGFIGADAAALAMEASGNHPGTGSSLIGVMQFGCAFLVSSIVTAMQNHTAYPLTTAIASCAVLSTAVSFWLGRNQS